MPGTLNSDHFLLGWREWVSLPDLGIPRIKSKVDTGARTSALHAFYVEKFKERGRDRVRFAIHPLQYRTDYVCTCECDMIDERIVSDSGGHRERRVVIRTAVCFAQDRREIEFTLTDRETMRFRMLLGRTALAGHFLVDSGRSYRLGKPAKTKRREK